MISTQSRCTAHHGERQKKQAGYFQPEHVQNASNRAESNLARPVKRADPAVLAAFASRDPEKSPAMSTEIAGWHGSTSSALRLARRKTLF
jgi:hypothetical protein